MEWKGKCNIKNPWKINLSTRKVLEIIFSGKANKFCNTCYMKVAKFVLWAKGTVKIGAFLFVILHIHVLAHIDPVIFLFENCLYIDLWIFKVARKSLFCVKQNLECSIISPIIGYSRQLYYEVGKNYSCLKNWSLLSSIIASCYCQLTTTGISYGQVRPGCLNMQLLSLGHK